MLAIAVDEATCGELIDSGSKDRQKTCREDLFFFWDQCEDKDLEKQNKMQAPGSSSSDLFGDGDKVNP